MNVTCITNLEFGPKKTFQKTTATIEMLKEKSSQVPQLPPGQIYKSVNIQVGNTGTSLSGNIENASIGFKVDRTWIRENIGKKSVICCGDITRHPGINLRYRKQAKMIDTHISKLELRVFHRLK